MSDSPNVKRVLICDDDEISRFRLARSVNKIGYEVIAEATTGLEAINLYVDKSPDIVLLDINMPVGGGLSVLSFIRDISSITRVVMITGNETNRTSDVVVDALKKGANDYLTKGNFDDNRLKKAVGHMGYDNESFDEKDAHSFVDLISDANKEIADKEKEEKKKAKADEPLTEIPEDKTTAPKPKSSTHRMARTTRR